MTTWVDAQWSNDPMVNTVVCSAEKDQKEAFIITDGTGGAIIAWRDYRFTESIFGGEIFSQRLNSDGTVQWAEDGIGVNAGSLNKGHFRPQMVEDNNGGGIIAWGRGPLFFYNYDIFAQKVNINGERSWALNDVTISDRTGTESFHQVTGDGSGGAIITWTHLPGTPGSTDIYAQRVDPEGNIKWAGNGMGICMATESQSYPVLIGDGDGGAIITWQDSREGTGETDIFAQKVDALGAVQWTVDGIEVSNTSYYQGFPAITGDGTGGAIIVWEDAREGNPGIYAQHINGDGESLWTTNGIKIHSATGNQNTPKIISDGAGGAIITWQDQSSGDMNIYAQRLNGSGEIQWGTNGMTVAGASGNQVTPAVISDNAGGIIICWADFRTDAMGDIYVQRLNGSGEALWQYNGIVVCSSTGYQANPCLATDGDMGAVIAWEDMRSGDNYDIYAQKVDKNGLLGIISDEDNDGISDTMEQGPGGDDPGYDGNTDGTPDSQQGNVASFKTYDGQQYVTLMVPDSVMLEEVKAIDNPDPGGAGAPDEDSYPYGFFSFSITGLTPGSHTVATLFLHNGPPVSQYFKYGPTPGENPHWYEFNHDGETGALFNVDTVFLHLKDGVRGDYDITANGTIKEPGGPVLLASLVSMHEAAGFGLEQNYPNPFRDVTNISFSVLRTVEVVIEVFDTSGRLVARVFEGKVPEGRYVTTWDATGVHKGIYILKMTDGRQSVTQKIVKLN